MRCSGAVHFLMQFRDFVYTNGTPRTSFPTGMRLFLSLPQWGKVADAGALARYDRFIGHRGRRMRCKTINYRLHYLDTLPLEHLIHHFFEMVPPFPMRGRLKYRDFVSAFYKAIPQFCLFERNAEDVVPYGYAVIPAFHNEAPLL